MCGLSQNNKMVELSELLRGQRYLFHIKNESKNNSFRANFIEITPKSTLIVTKYSDEKNNYENSKVCMPMEWIVSIESLDDIIGDTIFPNDILIEIDRML